MALIVYIQNDGTGSGDAANYDYQVRVGRELIASGRVEGHDREEGWRELVRRVASVPEPAASSPFPDAFLQAFSAFPKREGGNPKNRAFKAWKARRAQGISEADLLQSVLNYAAYIRAKGKEGSEYVKQAATFFGPDWQLEWKTSEAVRRPGEFVGE